MQTYCLLLVFSHHFLGEQMVFTMFCGRALWRALCMRCACTVACTVQNTMFASPLYFHQQNAAILLLEAWRHSLHWYTMQDTSRHTVSDLQLLPTCGADAAMLLLCLVGSSLEDESVFGLFWIEVLADAKGICSSLCLHIHKRKNLLPRS